jgi:adenosylmethionine-8-amino-7-oxononanoate aminotransferase
VEVALKMALQYQQGVGLSHKTKLMTIRGGYHGDTFGAMSVCDPVTGMHSLFSEVLPEAHFLPKPQTGFGEKLHPADRDALEQAMAKVGRDTAAFIVEPILQGAGGMFIYGEAYLQALREHCDRQGIVLIFDEIATGFGRTGKLFAYEHAQVVPDVLCVGKALTGGTMTLAATLTSDAIAEGICASEAGVFMHGPTFMGNPLACAAANASLALLANGNWQQQVKRIETQLETELAPCAELASVADVRVIGAVGVVETKEPVNVAEIQKRFINEGVWIRPFSTRVYIMPPYIISADELSRLTGAIYRALQ